MAERALVIVPTYNERENLPIIVPIVLEQDPRLEVLVIDDGSPDGTGELADALADADPRVHVIHRAGKQGLGTAYRMGFGWAIEKGPGASRCRHHIRVPKISSHTGGGIFSRSVISRAPLPGASG